MNCVSSKQHRAAHAPIPANVVFLTAISDLALTSRVSARGVEEYRFRKKRILNISSVHFHRERLVLLQPPM